MNAFVTAGAGFLLAVLWFDLMFDVQVLAHRDGELPEAVLSSIAGYYARVTTAARPMNRLIVAVMAGTLAGILVELAAGHRQRWAVWASLVLALAAILPAGARTVPRAVQLGSRVDPLARQGSLARSICREHLFAATAIAALLVLQLAFA